MILEHLPTALRKDYHVMLNEKFPGIAHESRTRALRLWKLSPPLYAAWRKGADAEAALKNSEVSGERWLAGVTLTLTLTLSLTLTLTLTQTLDRRFQNTYTIIYSLSLCVTITILTCTPLFHHHHPLLYPSLSPSLFSPVSPCSSIITPRLGRGGSV